jgi:hypothetical protein
VQLTEKEPGINDKCHADCARQDKIDWDWERISHETKETGTSLSSFETIYAPEFKLPLKNGCIHSSLFLILHLNILLY